MPEYDILIKGGTYLEDARKLRVVALDKTGTVTEGKPHLVEHVAIGTTADSMASTPITDPKTAAAGRAATGNPGEANVLSREMRTRR